MGSTQGNLALAFALGLAPATGALAITIDAPEVARLHTGHAEHCDEAVATRQFTAAFDCGDELFETQFNALDGGGANVGDGGRFTRVPRADLTGTGQWLRHVPARETGPNAEACNVCHNIPFDDGAGLAGVNVIRDPQRGGVVGRFIQRNAPHVFSLGALQRLAEEMNVDLLADETAAIAAACPTNAAARRNVNRPLDSKGVRFGTVEVSASPNASRCPSAVARNVQGVDRDLIVRPFQWKGTEPTVRAFNRGATHNELGMQSVEMTGDGVDGDGDGVVDELSVADQTALAIYLAAQPRPVSLVELDLLRQSLELRGDAGRAEAARLGLPTLTPADRSSLANGALRFAAAQCTSCHKPLLTVDAPIFSEPSQNPRYRDARFPAGQNPLTRGLDPARPIRFDLTRDQPDNVIEVAGTVVLRLGAFPRDPTGRAIVPLFGDLKRHEMGPGLAENVDETGHGRSVWMTSELWGVGSTGPYLHDGRATTLTEAILEHGGEATAARNAFRALPPAQQAELVSFLENLVLYKAPALEE